MNIKLFKYYILGFVFALATFKLRAQDNYNFNNKIEVTEGGKVLENPFAGGLNFVQIEEFDFNGDGLIDLFVFDRSGNRILPFISSKTNGIVEYNYDDRYVKYFPPLKNWVKIIDYNCDGKKDIFTYNPLGIEVWENNSASGEISFVKLSFSYNTSGGVKEIDAIKTDTGGEYDVNLSIIYQDIPAIADVDGDGSIDILNFGLGSAIPEGSTIEFHRNRAKCGLDFVRESSCWGGFAENYSNNSVSLGVCSTFEATKKATKMHAGSSLLLHDFDGNGLPDMLIGDITFENATMVYNFGSMEDAQMLDMDDNYPSYSTPINLEYFPGFSLLDIGLDGKLDLIASPAIRGSENKNSVWRYNNESNSGEKNFLLKTKGFLQEDMIDHGEASKPVIFDIDNDGKKDILVSNYGIYQKGGSYKSTIAVYRNTSSGEKVSFNLIDEDFSNLSQYNDWLNIYPAFGDLNNDGKADMILGEQDGLIHYFTSNSESVLEIKEFNYLGIDAGNSSAPYLYDINKDGLLDLLLGNKKGTIAYYENKGTKENPDFELKNNLWGGIDLSALDVQGAFLSLSILESNNKEVLLLGTQSGTVYAYEIDLSDNFNLISDNYFNFDEGDRASIATGDLNSDGLSDVLIGNMSGGLRLGINENTSVDDSEKLYVYPNPLLESKTFRIKGISNYKGISIDIIDLKGNHLPFNTEEDKIILQKLYSGVFIVKLEGRIKGDAKFIVKK